MEGKKILKKFDVLLINRVKVDIGFLNKKIVSLGEYKNMNEDVLITVYIGEEDLEIDMNEEVIFNLKNEIEKTIDKNTFMKMTNNGLILGYFGDYESMNYKVIYREEEEGKKNKSLPITLDLESIREEDDEYNRW